MHAQTDLIIILFFEQILYIYCTNTVSNATFKRRIFKHNKDCSDVTTYKF